ncbi:hypothetical protein T11_3795 [Trichinella zimbabwensis]|uniref:Uncharacterized protein n=1 Tax=Trichinella zimbabwensis TaxID=268475 RepID=A0A0V1GEZ8_9BILA|nr:hypothetical protein T11_16965 [Trichinella zimbabwensis]KRY96820.1 hypothetical protein T11_3057 [Trichinella zimbabwensis]KRY96825.1 hypothetical protein T11_3795 [Trichinella zimbabwensis]
MPPGHRRFTFVVVCARWRWRAFKMEKKEWRQITTAQKLQIIQTDSCEVEDFRICLQ